MPGEKEGRAKKGGMVQREEAGRQDSERAVTVFFGCNASFLVAAPMYVQYISTVHASCSSAKTHACFRTRFSAFSPAEGVVLVSITRLHRHRGIPPASYVHVK